MVMVENCLLLFGCISQRCVAPITLIWVVKMDMVAFAYHPEAYRFMNLFMHNLLDWCEPESSVVCATIM